jgi:hypothetical protein
VTRETGERLQTNGDAGEFGPQLLRSLFSRTGTAYELFLG